MDSSENILGSPAAQALHRWVEFVGLKRSRRLERVQAATADAHWATRLRLRVLQRWDAAVGAGWALGATRRTARLVLRWWADRVETARSAAGGGNAGEMAAHSIQDIRARLRLVDQSVTRCAVCCLAIPCLRATSGCNAPTVACSRVQMRHAIW
jgi:hypothetical protein